VKNIKMTAVSCANNRQHIGDHIPKSTNDWLPLRILDKYQIGRIGDYLIDLGLEPKTNFGQEI
jgi:hypothetical protein